MTDVAAVIGNFEGAALLPECLTSLRNQSHPPAEVIVVDASSRDTSIAVAEEHGARVLRCPNSGLGYLYNRGAEAARAPYVVFLNNDVVLQSNCVARLATELDRDAMRFAADPRQLDWEAKRTIHARTTLRRGRLFREFLPGLHLDHTVEASDVVTTVSAHGAAMLVRRDRHLELGGFDETFFLEWEDLDLCWRARLRGWPSVYVPDATVRHRVSAVTTAAIAPKRSASSHHNLLRFALKCLPRGPAATVAMGELLRLPAHPHAISLGMAALIRELREVLRQRRSLAPHRPAFDELLALGEPS